MEMMEEPEPMEVDSYPVMKGSCIHIEQIKNEDMLASYELLHAFYVSCLRKGAWQRKKRDCVCNAAFCETKRKRVHACLSCIYFGCFEGHIYFHAVEQNHILAVDTDTGQVFCFWCDDYKYDADFIKISQEQNMIASKQRGLPYKWEPSPEEVVLLRCHDVVYKSEKGVRGIVNCGKFSCYLIVILQCLIHAPVFRDHILSLQHKCKFSKNETGINPTCFVCEMTDFVQQSFSGESGPFANVGLLLLLFKRVKEYAKCDYEDASDCYNNLLRNLHEDTCDVKDEASWSCNCNVHTTFSFLFQKKCTCKECKNSSIRQEPPEWSVRLNLESLEESSEESSSVIVPVDHCLERIFSPEEIKEYFCAECNKCTGCTLQLIPDKLPLVMCFSIDLTANRYDSFIKYDEFVDMTSYVLPFKTEKKQKELFDNFEYHYFLFAVVEYEKLDKYGQHGHYRCYVKQGKQWYECDDHKTEPIAITDVLGIKARMLFYHRLYL